MEGTVVLQSLPLGLQITNHAVMRSCVVVKRVAADSAADIAGCLAGDILMKINGQPIFPFADAQNQLKQATVPTLLQIFRPRSHGGSISEGLKLPLTTDTGIENVKLPNQWPEERPEEIEDIIRVADSRKLGSAASSTPELFENSVSVDATQENFDEAKSISDEATKRRRITRISPLLQQPKKVCTLTHEYVVHVTEIGPLLMRLKEHHIADENSGEDLPVVRVENVTPGGIAERFGIKPGDIIFSINQKPVTDLQISAQQMSARPLEIQLLCTSR